MIREGRTVVDRYGVAEICNMSPSTALRKQPWNEPGHPKPVNGNFEVRGQRWMWDEQQTRAYHNGEKVRAIPRKNSPGDLLDLGDVAAELGKDIRTVTEMRQYGYLPWIGDEEPFGVWHIRRDTLASLPARHAGSPRKPKAEPKERVYQALREAGGYLEIGPLVQATGVSKPTALKHRKRFQQEQG